MNDGGPAFSRPNVPGLFGKDNAAQEGMSLRDYFAAHALELLISKHDPEKNLSSEEIAKLAYRTADAMIALDSERFIAERCAEEVHSHWNDSYTMTNQKEQAFRSGNILRQLAKELDEKA